MQASSLLAKQGNAGEVALVLGAGNQVLLAQSFPHFVGLTPLCRFRMRHANTLDIWCDTTTKDDVQTF